MNTKVWIKKAFEITALLSLIVIMSVCFAFSSLAASPYEVTKSGGALIRTSYAESASSVRRAAQGSIVWVASSKKNSAGNIWYQLTDGYWIYSGNVKSHSCTWTYTGGVAPGCLASGANYYKCNKCGQTKTVTVSANGHKYEGNVCKTCGAWNVSSLKSRTSVNNVRYYVKTDGAKVHSGPYGACRTVTTLSKGTNIYVTEKVVNASNNTWYRYGDGYIFSDYVVNHSSCSWNSGYISKNATCTSTGIKVQNCTICGAGKSTQIAQKSHSYVKNVCNSCGGWNTSSLKSKSTVNNVRYYVKTNGAKVRSGPYENCSIVTTLNKGTDIYVTEKVVNASSNTWYKYSGGYIFSDYVVNHSSCSWNSGSVTKAATCTSTGTKVQSCTICGKSKTTEIAKKSHKYEDNVCSSCGGWSTSSLKSKAAVSNVRYYIIKDGAKVHTGPYSGCKTAKTLSKGTHITVTEKVVNASKNTWYKYSDGYIFSDYAVEHSSCKWNSGSVTKKATCTSTGTKVYKCTVCGKSKTTEIAKKSHKYEDNVCNACGKWDTSSLKSKTVVSNVRYYVIKDGAKVHTGPYGGCKTVKTLSKGTHITVTEKVVNASKNTWYKYSDGYIFSDYAVEHSSCKWNSGSVTKKATCTSTGTKVYKCTVCGKSKTTEIAKKSHKYEDNVCKFCGKWNTSSLKSKTAVNNVKYCVITDSAKVHTGPYGGCKTVKTLSKGTQITVTEKLVNAENNTWYRYKDGYIYGKYVQDYALYTAKTTLNAESLTMYVGQEKTLKATVKGPSSEVTWKSSDTSVATVSSKGKITCKKTGTCTITAKANGKSDSCKITAKQLSAPKDISCSTVKTGRSFKVSHGKVSGADGYELAYIGLLSSGSAVGETKLKTYTGTSATVSVDKSDECTYKFTVRAYKLIDGKKLYGKASKSYSVHVHNNKTETVKTEFSAVNYTTHNKKVTYKYNCYACKQKITHTKTKEYKHTFVCEACQLCGKEKASGYVTAAMYSSAGKKIYAAAKYSDSLFSGKSTSFSSDLCKLSAVGAAVSYDKSFAVSFLEKCGFKAVKPLNSSSKKSTAAVGDSDHARFIIGYKTLKGTDKTLVAVLINGYTDGAYEWISNFDVGTCGLHYGFSTAADEVTAAINNYISAQKLNKSKLKLWLTGHSRGGAVTGMTAVNLNEKYSYGTANIYAYGFATPNGVPVEIAEKTNSNNVFNIVNPGDFVPYVVPSEWGFTKFEAKSKGTEKGTKVISPDTKAKNMYKALTGDTYSGLTVSEREKIIKAFCEYSPSREAYYTVKGAVPPASFGRAIGLSKSAYGLGAETLGLLELCGFSDTDSLTVLGEMVYNGVMTSKINEAHCMETYICMVNSQYS